MGFCYVEPALLWREMERGGVDLGERGGGRKLGGVKGGETDQDVVKKRRIKNKREINSHQNINRHKISVMKKVMKNPIKPQDTTS